MRRRARRILPLLAAALLAACAAQHEPLRHERAFPPEFRPPLSHETGQPVYGWGGSLDGGPVSPSHTPVLFIHGNTVDATFWRKARRAFRAAGYSDDELWAPTYGYGTTDFFDNNDLSVPTLNAFVDAVRDYLQRKTGRRVAQFDIVAHSLGVTVVRQWLTQTNRWHEVRNLVAVAGANHGVWTAYADARGPSRAVSFELAPGSPWLAQLNRHGETPGAARVLTLYDGTGRYDVLFPPPDQDSGALAGATRNLPYDRELGGGYDHLDLPRSPATLRTILDFIKAAPEPLPQARPPVLLRRGDLLLADQPEAELRCAVGGAYPNAATPAAKTIALDDAEVRTCYAYNARSALPGPMTRVLRAAASPSPPEPLRLSASPAAGVFEQPQRIALTASDPAAMIVYSTAGTVPDSGAALYDAPVFVAAPLTLTAVAIAPDGRRSAPLRLEYNISLQYEDALHALQRQFDPQAPIADRPTGDRSGR
ncbi:MAG: hypothetical protein NVS9B10_16870 [Nevskia sp.]